MADPNEHAPHIYDEHVEPPPTRDPSPTQRPPNHDAQPIHRAATPSS